jgi:outer membrane protein OmpA-like peptidoglycan-associated protein
MLVCAAQLVPAVSKQGCGEKRPFKAANCEGRHGKQADLGGKRNRRVTIRKTRSQ